MLSTNSPIDWTKFMNQSEIQEYLKTPEFREWLIGLLSEQSPATITFTKKDGTNRVMKCTRSPSLIPEEHQPKDGKTNDSETSLRVFDLDKNEWRSFIIENIKRIQYNLE